MLSEVLPVVETIGVWSSALAFRLEPRAAPDGLLFENADCTPADPLAVYMSAGLSEGLIQRNVFSEPWMLQAAGAHLSGSRNVRVLTSRGSSGVSGIVPVVLPSGLLSRLPIADVWVHLHCFESTPLVQSEHVELFLEDLFRWLERHDIAVLRWPRLCLDGPFTERLLRYVVQTGRASGVVTRTDRPALFMADRPEQANKDRVLSKKRRRKVERCRRRLSELGSLEFRSMEQQDDPDGWLAEFLRLEASGWKGDGGSATALTCRAEERAFFKRVFHEAVRRDQILMHSLELNGRPIAMTVNYRSGDGLWAYKTAYDEAYARYGPGVLLELEGTMRLIENPGVSWADSCSDTDNLVMQEFWPDRRPIGDLVVAVKPGRSLAVPAITRAQRAYVHGKQLARSAYWRFRDWRNEGGTHRTAA